MSMYWSMRRPDTVARAAGARAEAKAANVQDEVRRLEDHVERLSLMCQALWELVREKTHLTEEELEQKVMEVDLRDGRHDGKMNRIDRNCPQCGRALHKRHEHCLYCGHDVGKDHAFQA